MRFPSLFPNLFLIIGVTIWLAACGGGGSSDEKTVSTPVTAQASPANGSTINGKTSIVITFSDTMAPSSVVIGGSLGGESNGGTWSQGQLQNDTITLSPTSAWSSGSQTLLIDADSNSGTSVERLNLQYTVDVALEVNSLTPTSGGTILNQQKIVVVFD